MSTLRVYLRLQLRGQQGQCSREAGCTSTTTAATTVSFPATAAVVRIPQPRCHHSPPAAVNQEDVKSRSRQRRPSIRFIPI